MFDGHSKRVLDGNYYSSFDVSHIIHSQISLASIVGLGWKAGLRVESHEYTWDESG